MHYTSSWNSNSTVTYLPLNKKPFRVDTIVTGYNGSTWITDKDTPTLWGNRNTEIDIAGKITGAWQIFYPFQF